METDQTAPDHVLATYAEIKARFGLGTSDAARIKAKRRKWPTEPPNHPGALTVIRVPKSEWDAGQAERSPRINQRRSKPIGDLTPIVEAMIGERDRLLAEQERLIGERDRLLAQQERLIEERDRLIAEQERLMGERDRAQTETEQLRLNREVLWQEREDARVRTALAEGEVAALREALAEARRPFWRRWIG